MGRVQVKTGGSVNYTTPERLRDPSCFYCEFCKGNYTRYDELVKHSWYNCLQDEREFICPECNAGYYYEVSVREHYYKVHLKTFLHFCTKCGDGFHHKSGKSSHMKTKCAKKEGPDVCTKDIWITTLISNLCLNGERRSLFQIYRKKYLRWQMKS